MLVVAIDLNKINEDQSPDQKLRILLDKCVKKDIPVIFSCTRKELGFSLYGRKLSISTKASVIGIVNYQGFEKVE